MRLSYDLDRLEAVRAAGIDLPVEYRAWLLLNERLVGGKWYPQADLPAALDASPSAVSRALDRLHRRGLIDRHPCKGRNYVRPRPDPEAP